MPTLLLLIKWTFWLLFIFEKTYFRRRKSPIRIFPR